VASSICAQASTSSFETQLNNVNFKIGDLDSGSDLVDDSLYAVGFINMTTTFFNP
jgi:hypothetical protein